MTLAYRKGTDDELELRSPGLLAGLPEYRPRPVDTVVDVGAHIGSFTLSVAPLVESVVAIEPHPDNYRMLLENSGKLHNVETVEAAIEPFPIEYTLLHLAKATRGHSTTYAYPDSITVRARTLAEVVDTRDCLGLLKLNCEGAEFGIIEGAPIWLLGRFRVILALYHQDLADGRPEAIVRRLEKAGFRTEIRNRHARLPRGWVVGY